MNLVESLYDCGFGGETIEAAAEGIRVSDELGMEHSYGHYIRLNGAACAYAIGRWDLARTWAEEAMTRAPTGWGAELYRFANTLVLYVAEGSFDIVDAGLARAFELLDATSGAQFIGPIHAAAAERELWRHRPLEALALAERGIDWMAPTEDGVQTMRLCRVAVWAAADLGEAARATRDAAGIEDAGIRLARVAARLDELEARFAGASGGRELAANRLTAAAEATRVDGRSDPAAWRAVAEAWEAFERPYFAAYARWREAEAALAAGDRAAATDALRLADAGAERLGARPLRDAIEALARRARISLSAPADGRPRASRRRGSVRTHPARARGPGAGRRWAHEPPDRRAPVHQREHGRRPRLEHHRQARCRDPRRGGGDRIPAPARSRRSRGGRVRLALLD